MNHLAKFKAGLRAAFGKPTTQTGLIARYGELPVTKLRDMVEGRKLSPAEATMLMHRQQTLNLNHLTV